MFITVIEYSCPLYRRNYLFISHGEEVLVIFVTLPLLQMAIYWVVGIFVVSVVVQVQ